MPPVNLGYATELAFPLFDGEVLERDGYSVIRTPNNPGYYWGNFLLFGAPPEPADLTRWPDLFAREFPHSPHCALGWDRTDGERGALEAFRAEGYAFQDELVQRHRGPAPDAPAVEGFALRRLAGPDTALNLAGDPRDGQGDAYAAFKSALRERYRAMVEAGLGCWFAASPLEAPHQVVAQLGIFRAPNGRARFQSVETLRGWQRRGLCRALVRLALRTALAEWGAREVVIVADPTYHAAALYRKAGFVDLYPIHGVYRAASAGQGLYSPGP